MKLRGKIRVFYTPKYIHYHYEGSNSPFCTYEIETTYKEYFS